MDIADIATGSVPVYTTHEPILILIDAREARRAWVISLLAFANYRVYAASTSLEAFTWYLKHPVMPQALLLGQVTQQEYLFISRLLQRIKEQTRKQLPIIPLETYLPTSYSPLATGSRGSYGLLEHLWRVVARPRRTW
jgi:hypothetical protein